MIFYKQMFKPTPAPNSAGYVLNALSYIAERKSGV